MFKIACGRQRVFGSATCFSRQGADLARFCSALLRALVASKSGLAESRRGGGAQIANAHCFETWDEAAKLAHMRIAYAPSRLMEVCEREYLAGQRRIIKLLMRGIPFRISVGAVVITL